MNSTGIKAIIVVISCAQNLVFAKICSTDADCSYGGTCDTVTRECTCTFGCAKLGLLKLVCAEKRDPMTECIALTNACEKQRSVVLRPFDLQQYRRTHNCKRIKSRATEEFCADQSFCGGNGICLKKIGSTQLYCKCSLDFFGERCQNKRAHLERVGIGSGHPRRRRAIGPIPLAATAMLSIVLITTAVFYIRKRSPTDNEEKTEKNQPRKTADSIEGVNIVHCV